MSSKNPRVTAIAGFIALTCTQFACGVDRAEVVSSYAELVEASYGESVTAAETLATKIKEFTASPSAATLQAAKDAWIASREPYLQTEVYRFYEGPIDNETDGPEGALNAWPMDEKYLDYVDNGGMVDNGGLINDTMFDITADSIAAKNEAGGEKNISTGYHAIEFLLWGQDLSEGAGAGNRPHTDFVDGGTAPNADRRRLYLEVAADLLVSDLKSVHDQWKTDGAYRKQFTEADADESLEKILTGMIVLTGFETGGERLQAALDSGDREDEHSCFSDNTHRDMIQDIQGIINVWEGTYTFQDGTKWEGESVKSVVEDVDSELADKLSAQLADALAKANALQTPFDQEISKSNMEGNARVTALISALQDDAEKTMQTIFTELGFTVPMVE